MPANLPLSGVSVMLVDDNAANLRIGTQVLEHLGARVVTAPGGIEALRLAAKAKFDLAGC